MKKFLIGLPVILIGLFLLALPGLMFGKVGMAILEIIAFIVLMGFVSYAIGEEMLEKKK